MTPGRDACPMADRRALMVAAWQAVGRPWPSYLCPCQWGRSLTRDRANADLAQLVPAELLALFVDDDNVERGRE